VILTALVPLSHAHGAGRRRADDRRDLTETIFAWPGIGRYAVESAANLDYPDVLGTTLLIAVIYILVNLTVDVLYGVLDPRIRE
jgi:peptide/nickel transport system permease protein